MSSTRNWFVPKYDIIIIIPINMWHLIEPGGMHCYVPSKPSQSSMLAFAQSSRTIFKCCWNTLFIQFHTILCVWPVFVRFEICSSAEHQEQLIRAATCQCHYPLVPLCWVLWIYNLAASWYQVGPNIVAERWLHSWKFCSETFETSFQP